VRRGCLGLSDVDAGVDITFRGDTPFDKGSLLLIVEGLLLAIRIGRCFAFILRTCSGRGDVTALVRFFFCSTLGFVTTLAVGAASSTISVDGVDFFAPLTGFCFFFCSTLGFVTTSAVDSASLTISVDGVDFFSPLTDCFLSFTEFIHFDNGSGADTFESGACGTGDMLSRAGFRLRDEFLFL